MSRLELIRQRAARLGVLSDLGDPLPRRKPVTCGRCGERGHNLRTCPLPEQLASELEAEETPPPAPSEPAPGQELDFG